MFEIGPALREARERRRLGLAQVEADTKIRARYIRALEDEDFAVLPGATYTKGFLRAYADYLGLDGQLFVDEFNSRHYDPRLDEDALIYRRPRSQPRRRQRRESNLVMIALAGIVAVSALVILGWKSSGGDQPSGLQPTVPTTTAPRPPASQPQTATTHRHRRHRPAKKKAAVAKPFTVTIGTSSGCWVSVRRHDMNGPAVVSTRGTDLSSYTLAAGEDVAFSSRAPVYVRLGAPTGVTLTIDGRVTPLPPISAGALLRIGRSGVTQA
jgi:cytoskeleton protein RodZ